MEITGKDLDLLLKYKLAFELACEELSEALTCDHCKMYSTCHADEDECVEKLKEKILKEVENERS